MKPKTKVAYFLISTDVFSNNMELEKNGKTNLPTSLDGTKMQIKEMKKIIKVHKKHVKKLKSHKHKCLV